MTEKIDIPIFKKSYDFYKAFYIFRTTIPKQDKYAIWQKAENLAIEILEGIMTASYKSKFEKSAVLEKVSINLNLLRMLLRLMKEVKTIDNKRYTALEEILDEIGRMLGGWIRSLNPR